VCMGGETCTKYWWGNPQEENHLEDLGIEETILKRNFKKHILVGRARD
jgi:hypothetical protein